ncbi:DUF29 domain-containing protein [Nostoc sp. FACHB-152]|uniref:DUF29 domain-containing protein n=1 Tax=unclassified Nostoc TaxID=2593658 RepID=UPI0016895547|nr:MULTISPECIES: DUF29 domain-containing protein [unclassified Nostoc]MBD2451814.1 DUF29 domain-containing protein [Nostoc sp. FACHB-152]MBD2472898.1 DUF29 domain-containing protein [Nostoc sp. FACHB-145]
MTQNIQKTDVLYDSDFVAWCERTVAQLKAKDVDNLDFDNLIEEIASLGKSERRELRNHLLVLIAHILKRMYVNSPENFNGWEVTIIEQRKQLKGLLKDSPSLKPYLTQIFTEVYADALEIVAVEYKQTEFPDTWQFDFEIDPLLFVKYWEAN